MKEKSTQVFMGIKYQKKVLSVFAYQLYSIDSVFKTSKNYHFQVFFEEFKYVVKEKKTAKYITDSLWSTLFNKRNHVYVDKELLSKHNLVKSFHSLVTTTFSYFLAN